MQCETSLKVVKKLNLNDYMHRKDCINSAILSFKIMHIVRCTCNINLTFVL